MAMPAHPLGVHARIFKQQPAKMETLSLANALVLGTSGAAYQITQVNK